MSEPSLRASRRGPLSDSVVAFLEHGKRSSAPDEGLELMLRALMDLEEAQFEPQAPLTALAAAIGQLLRDPELSISERQYFELCRLSDRMNALFRVTGAVCPRVLKAEVAAQSGARGLEPPARVQERHEGGPAGAESGRPITARRGSLSEAPKGRERPLRTLRAPSSSRSRGGSPPASLAGARRFWPLCHLDNLELGEAEALLEEPPDIRIPAGLALLSTSHVLSLEAEGIRSFLLEHADTLFEGQLSEPCLARLPEAWLRCSFSSHPNKHDAKQVLNRMARSWLRSQGLHKHERRPGPSGRPQRPTVAVLAEWLSPGHAVCGNYAAVISQLKSRFRVVLVGAQDGVDSDFGDIADDFAPLPLDGGNYGDIAAFLRRLRPDIVYYPSIGFKAWTIFFCNLRFAPLQIMTLGHPASSRSKAMDFAITEEGCLGDLGLYSERIYLTRDFGLPARGGSAAPPSLAPSIREEADPVRVAVPAPSMALNGRFLAALQAIQRDADRPVEYHFFSTQAPIYAERMALDMRRMLPGAQVHASTPNETYLAAVNRCDLYFSAFPMAGLHSDIDWLGQGIPVLCRMGRDLPERSDVEKVARRGLRDILAVPDEDAFRDRALQLINVDEVRLSLSRRLLDPGPGECLSNPEDACPPDEFLHAVEFLYENRERLLRSKRRLLTYRDAETAAKTPSSIISARPPAPRVA